MVCISTPTRSNLHTSSHLLVHLVDLPSPNLRLVNDEEEEQQPTANEGIEMRHICGVLMTATIFCGGSHEDFQKSPRFPGALE